MKLRRGWGFVDAQPSHWTFYVCAVWSSALELKIAGLNIGFEHRSKPLQNVLCKDGAIAICGSQMFLNRNRLLTVCCHKLAKCIVNLCQVHMPHAHRCQIFGKRKDSCESCPLRWCQISARKAMKIPCQQLQGFCQVAVWKSVLSLMFCYSIGCLPKALGFADSEFHWPWIQQTIDFEDVLFDLFLCPTTVVAQILRWGLGWWQMEYGIQFSTWSAAESWEHWKQYVVYLYLLKSI